MKVLFLTKYPTQGASSRYRVYQYLPYFSKIQYKAQSLYGQRSYKLLYQKGKLFQKLVFSIIDYWRRSFFIIRNLNVDLVYMQRESLLWGPLWAENLYRWLNIKIIFDLDDALFINKINHNHTFKIDKAKRVKKIIKRVDLIISGNSWLRNKALELGAKRSVHIEIAETVQFKKSKNPPKKKEDVNILWLGSPTTTKYLKLIETPLMRIQKKFNSNIFLVGADENYQFLFDSEIINWSQENENKFLEKCNIGIMPLPSEEWSKGKCGGKARTYMASGIVPVVSKIGYNMDLIEEKKSGFLCEYEDDWYHKINFLFENITEIERIQKTNWKKIESQFNTLDIAKTIENQILSLEN